ncbi:5-(carboxyamino)imidazole ribonucleotide synthase [Aureimonas phyllosphaerae]|uniref:N5-carboxyaminoimidazole ribonucleotide synthase n=1 Tax=Aureimonas phyllosphaerae TaxID=1166078 RepID=A0A7W6BL12_9HYPH|nr:5-(carboxyamino)imidazole ribonucleotide synthase [Aureimonas phyllosphaerae]MBB3933934.1 5-(carboxyamino)imidazole ribonucleotide synthase [Aureimonas phyllosphaerae]MBB3958850.1 5-(carboxyamino)imidazole ribonucleotide synthase [Aureimonas phyllosphaerae]SFF20180.1 5-(carboxyamino)imidazole ribonucleotide synthase [Aureimonas phyllosphaerae]
MTAPLPFGSTIGIIGGGQLGRMLASSAARLGFRTLVLDPDADCPAAQVANELIRGAYDDAAALRQLADRSDVVTYEFENVPVGPLRALQAAKPIHPPIEALEVAQDRVVEKAFLNGIGIATAPWRAVDDPQELDHALLDLRGDCILKTRRLGYDGKGQATIADGGPHDDVFESLGSVPAILEKKVPFEREISVISARGQDGSFVAFDPAENVHRMGILSRSTVPAKVPQEIAERAVETARAIMDRLGYVGVIGVEFFVGTDGTLLVNEIAPRVHNSGHWTEAACTISQFEQHIRAVAGHTLGPANRHSDCVMENLIGHDVERAEALLTEPDTLVTLYGKREARPGRKMGHVTRLSPRKAI